MANWAKIDNNNIVKEILVFDDGVVPLIPLPTGWQWIQDTEQIKNDARTGDRYDEQRNAFMSEKPFPSWLLNEETCLWDAPVPYPDDETLFVTYIWNESSQTWDKLKNG
jgi:hypothetical protein